MKKRYRLALAATPILGLSILIGCNTPAGTGGFRPDPTAITGNANNGQIAAATGGVVTSADGTMTLTIPPNALSQDAVVKVEPYDTSKLKADDPMVMIFGGIPGISMHLDLGGAFIETDQELKVIGKVDPRFIESMKDYAKQHDKPYNPADYNLSQAPNGDWMLTMAVKGPTSSQDPTAGLPDLASPMWEFNMLPLTPEDSKANAYRLLARYNDPATAPNYYDNYSAAFHDKHAGVTQAMVNSYPSLFNQEASCTPGNACNWNGGYHQLNCMLDWYNYHNYSDSLSFKRCSAGCEKPPKANLDVNVKWASDDTRLDGKNANKVIVTWDNANSKSTSSGHQVLQQQVGDTVQVDAFENSPNLNPKWDKSGTERDTKNVKVAQGGSTVNLQLDRYRPQVTLTATNAGGTKNASSAAVVLNRSASGAQNVTATLMSQNIGAVNITTADDVYSETGSIANKSYSPGTGVWLDIAGNGSATLKYNSKPTVNYKVWFNSDSKGSFNYSSDDSGAVKDLLTNASLPATVWNAKAGSGSIKFSHSQSTAPTHSWPTAMTFTGASGTAWGLNGAAGTGTVSVSGDITLSATKAYTVGNDWTATIAAMLPKVKFKLINDLPSNVSKLKIRFKVDSGAERVVALQPYYSAGTVTFPVPVEDALNVPKNHTFTILSIFQDDNGNNVADAADSYRAVGPNNGAFPAVSGLHRNATATVTDMGNIDSLLLIPKYRSN